MASRVERDSRGRFRQHVEPAGYTGDSEADTSNPEVLDPNSVEVIIGDPKVDAPLLLEFYTRPTTREHLQGIVPISYIEEIKDLDTGEVKEKREIPATTVEDIKRRYENPNLVLLTAVNPFGRIVGVTTVEKLSPNVADIGQVVVDEEYRGNRIVDKMLKAANALALREGSGGLDCTLAQAFVIVGDSVGNHIPGYHIAINAFRRQGYEIARERVGGTRSWSNESGRLVDRNSVQMELQRRKYKQDFSGDHITFFPKPRPPKAA